MDGHDWWHLVVLGSTLFGAAGLGILALYPFISDEPLPKDSVWRPIVLVLAATSVALLAVEWLGIH